MDVNDVIGIISGESIPFSIFGAQVIAYGAYVAILALTGRVPSCFAVGCIEGNPPVIECIPVKNIDDVSRDSLVIVGVTELIQKEVLPMLSEKGFNNVVPLTQYVEHLLMSAYFNLVGLFPTVDGAGDFARKDNNNLDSFVMYQIMNDRDKKLIAAPELKPFERCIQAGAAISNAKICELTDDNGANISDKNRQYCEMTAVYWIWKNRRHDWVGVEHYRRHLLVKPEMLGEDVDVIMPLPYICYPNEAAQFRRFVSEDVLQAVLKALQELHPGQYEAYRDIIYGQYQYTYNLMCARWDVFDDYCSWFFEITEYMEKTMADDVPELLETRAFSYIAEVLTNLYFMSRQKDLRIRHVEKGIYT